MPEKKLIASGKQPSIAPTPPGVAPTPESEPKPKSTPEGNAAPKPNNEKVRNPFYQPVSASVKEFSPGKSLTPVTTPVTTPMGTRQNLYLHMKPIQKMFVLVSMLFSLQIQT